ncbi:MAG TPA: 4Fe-4S dicluster domain-containing protein [Terriglobales bacterium]|nr:4Fe-4S dicluster domain-containing protein [Terriglobales bacterium]
MAADPTSSPGSVAFERADLDRLFGLLHERGYTVVGPTLRQGAVVLDEIEDASRLPAGWTDDQEAGQYRLRRSGSPALFDGRSGPASAKRALLPPTATLLQARRAGATLELLEGDPPPPKLACLGVRACDLAAIEIQDRVLLGGSYQDPIYRARRENLLVIAVQCASAGGTCFCASMGTGPEVRSGHDLALAEIVADGRHTFVASAGTAHGRELLDGMRARPATAAEQEAVRAAVARCRASMGRTLDTDDLPGLLARTLEHPNWDAVALRCLACGNCVLVCPTCFCVNTEDVTDVPTGLTRRVRRWDTCYSLDYSYIHGGNVRTSIRARYRQWLTHKLGTWHAQFGTTGCVGCGRCITWCPAAIDITEEAAKLRQPPARKEASRGNA